MSLDVSLRDRQISILQRMLHLNKEGSADLTLASKSEEIIWKVLVLDAKSRSVLSSVLRVNDLLKCGITVHSLINSKRANLPDVPVIYFVEPTIENILYIIEDLNQDRYDSFYINFTSLINRELLEEFAKKVSISGKSQKIKQVFDQYLDYIVTEPNLFSLNLPEISLSLTAQILMKRKFTSWLISLPMDCYPPLFPWILFLLYEHNKMALPNLLPNNWT